MLSHIQLFVAPWTIAQQVPLPVEFSRQEYWSGLSFPSPRYALGKLRLKLTCNNFFKLFFSCGLF